MLQPADYKNNPRQQCKTTDFTGNTVLYPTALPFITSQVILIRGYRRHEREGVKKRADESAHLSVTVRSSLRPPVPSFPPFISFQLTSVDSHFCTFTHMQTAFTHLYMQISGDGCFSRVKKQHQLSMSEYVLRFTLFWCL